MDDKYLVCLCHKCRQQFRDAGGYRLKRVVIPQENKEVCTYCQSRYGYDYYLVPADKDAAV